MGKTIHYGFLSYSKITDGFYSVFLGDIFIGEVRKYPNGWYFRTFTDPVFVSEIPSDNRIGAVVQWPGLCDIACTLEVDN